MTMTILNMKALFVAMIALRASSAFTAPSRNAAARMARIAPEPSTTQLNGAFGRLLGREKSSLADSEVRDLFYLWNDALATKNSKIVAKRYSSDPILLPTVSDTPRTDYDSIKDYFDNFLQLEPQGVILDGKIASGENWAKDAGIYEFTMGKTGDKVRARYSFLYVRENGKWRILHHHSSTMPETKGKRLSENEVRNLFNLWNDALATLDPETVAQRYATSSLLLPTVSDKACADYDSKVEYFTNFLKKKPQGTILESYVEIGDDMCKDAGIYEFKMGDNGDVVKARYSFVYIQEDGQWKISHHHSSIMPEAALAALAKN